MNFLVTGATGFIGNTVARHMLASGHRVYALHRRPAQAASLGAEGFMPIIGDLADLDLLPLPQVDAIIHAGAIINNGTHETYRLVNVQSTAKLAAWARSQTPPPRLVYISSVGVYGELACQPADEQTPCRPVNDYELTKLAAEQEVLAAASRGLPTVVIRPTWVYGPGDRKNLKLFQLINRGRFPLIGSGKTLLSPIFSEDLAAGIALAAISPKAVGQTLIMGPPVPVTLLDLCSAAAQALGKPAPHRHIPLALAFPAALLAELLWQVLPGIPPLSRRRLLFFTRSQTFSIARAAELLNFTAGIGLTEGMQRTADWYKQRGWLT
jgi:dihydroflavonol-4-reductase